MTKRKNSPRWFAMHDEIASSLGLLNSLKADFQTIKVLNNVTTMLLSGKPLTDGQKKTFIDCIRKRTRHTNFDFTGPIILSPDQLKDARRKREGRLIPLSAAKPIPPTFPAADEKEELLDAFQCYFHLISPEFPFDFPHISTKLGARRAELLEFWSRNGMKWNGINHEAIICPTDGVIFAMTPDAHEEVSLPQEPAAPAVIHAKTVIENKVTHEVKPGAPSGERRKARQQEIVVSYFHTDPAKAPSAMFEFGEEKFSLLFATAHVAEEKLRLLSDPEWISLFEEKLGTGCRAMSWAAQQRGCVSRYIMSPLYAPNDKYGYKPPVVPNCVVALYWEDQTPTAAFLLAGESLHLIPLERFSNGEKDRPLFKGRIAMPPVEEELSVAA